MNHVSNPPDAGGPPLTDVTVGMATRDDDPTIFARALDAALAEPMQEPPLVVDMSRGDGIRAVAQARGTAVRYVAFPESRGLSDSRNRIVSSVATRYLLFLDADAVPAAGWANAVRERFERDERAAIVGARCLPVWPRKMPPLFDTAPARDFLGMLDLGSQPIAVPRIVGTSFALDRDRLPRREPFRLELGRRPGSDLGGEEIALCEEVRAAGWSVVYEPGAVVHHHVRRGRDRWRWMLRRAFAAGREAARLERRLEPLPRRMSARDRVFLAAIAPAFLVGRLSERGSG